MRVTALAILACLAAPAHASVLTDYFAASWQGTPLKCDTPLPFTKYDWGRFQARDSVLSCDGRVVIETFHNRAPFTEPFSATKGDGGQLFVDDGHAIRAAATQDGGSPGMQYFLGHGQGGDGWLVYWDAVTWNSCGTKTAMLGGSSDPNAQQPLHGAETHACWNSVWWPLRWNGGSPLWYYLPTITSWHCDGDGCERMMFAYGWGLLRWDAWAPRASTVDLSARCPLTWQPPAYGAPPRPGWQMVDCRMMTDIQLTPGGTRRAVDFQWPPIGSGIWP
jgi:hypothetical protein